MDAIPGNVGEGRYKTQPHSFLHVIWFHPSTLLQLLLCLSLSLSVCACGCHLALVHHAEPPLFGSNMCRTSCVPSSRGMCTVVVDTCANIVSMSSLFDSLLCARVQRLVIAVEFQCFAPHRSYQFDRYQCCIEPNQVLTTRPTTLLAWLLLRAALH
jgi:hypothetical protein